MLVGTFALFLVLARMWGNPVEWLMAIVVVIVLHEAGHYLVRVERSDGRGETAIARLHVRVGTE